jgi:hypothetical protein
MALLRHDSKDVPVAPRSVGSRLSVPRWVTVTALLSPCAAVLLFAAVQPIPAQVAATGLVVAGAGAVSGALIGFIFGVPRVLTGDRPAADRASSPKGSVIVANTNLEQISDWLTKILVGVGLTQFRPIIESAGRLFEAMGPAFGGGPAGSAFAGALLTYSATGGFVAGWLLTRLRLSLGMAEADQRARQVQIDQELERAIEKGAGVDLPSETQRAPGLDEPTRKALESMRANTYGNPLLAIKGTWRLVREAAKKALGVEANEYPDTPARVQALRSRGRLSDEVVQKTLILRRTYDDVRNNAEYASPSNALGFIELAEQVIAALGSAGREAE